VGPFLCFLGGPHFFLHTMAANLAADLPLTSDNGPLFSFSVDQVLSSIRNPDLPESQHMLKTTYEEYDGHLTKNRFHVVINHTLAMGTLDAQDQEFKLDYRTFTIKERSGDQREVEKPVVITRDPVTDPDTLKNPDIQVITPKQTGNVYLSRVALLIIPVKNKEQQRFQLIHVGGNMNIRVRSPNKDSEFTLPAKKLTIQYAEAPFQVSMGGITFHIH
jgi:hypothetical protein